MTIETALYPNQLNATLPPQSDIVREGAGHLRLLKTVVKTTFPNVAGAVSASQVELNYVTGVTSGIQAQIATKGAIAGQTWTGAHVFSGSAAVPTLAQGTKTTGAASTAFVQAEWETRLPNYTTPITASSTELNRLVGVTSGVQSQINSKAAKAGDTYTGAHNYTDATITVPTLAAGSFGNSAASVDYANAVAFASALPSQTGNSGKFITTNGVTASWSDAIDGNLSFTGAARRITGDFSNASIANRLMFQTSAANSPTTLGVLPSGTSEAAALAAYAKSDPANTSSIRMLATSIDCRLDANRSGTGSYLPMTFYVGGAERLRVDPATGNVLATSGVLGYGVGAGGIAVQATSKSTAVTLNKPSGRVTMHNAALAAGASVSWVCVNTYVQANCCVVASGIYDGGAVYPANYQIDVAQVGMGAFEVRVKNITASALSDALQIQFDVFQGAVS